MPIFTVQLLEGRSDEQKAALIRAVTEAAVATLAVPADIVRIIIHDVPPANWGRAGTPVNR